MSGLLAFAAALFLLLSGSIPAAAQSPDIDCSNAVSTVEMKFCAGQDYDLADAELNAIWKKVMAHARSADKDWLPEGAPTRVDLLRDAQRKWIAYRDAACEAEATKFYGGTGQTLILVVCLTNKTNQRTADLRSYMAEG
ncbi:MAG: lysozyme inhibitor LprI family protein [Pseudomonadota bacterium]